MLLQRALQQHTCHGQGQRPWQASRGSGLAMFQLAEEGSGEMPSVLAHHQGEGLQSPGTSSAPGLYHGRRAGMKL